MKLRLRLHETRETLNLELADTDTLHDLRQLINPTAPSSVHLSLNRKEELLAPSPEDTLRSLGVTSGDLIYYSLDQSAFAASINSGKSSNWKLGDCETLGSQSERNKAVVHDSMEGPVPMDVVELAAAKSKRLSIPFFLKNVLLEKCGDTSDLTALALSVHAVLLESGFVLLDHGSDKFSFSKELLSVSLRYTLPELITRKDTNTIESVTVRFQNLGPRLVVYGTLGGHGGRVHMTYLDKRRFLPVIDSVVDTLKFEKQGSSSYYREVFMLWRMVKDDLVIPLWIGLCDKAGLESPPCLMLLPTELKLKILESLPGVSIGNMACVCTEMRYLASDNNLWKQKCLEEGKDCLWKFLTAKVDWKCKFSSFWREKRLSLLARRNPPLKKSNPRFPPIIRDRGDPRYPFDHLGPRDFFDRFSPRDPFYRFGPRDPRDPIGPFRIHPGRALADVSMGTELYSQMRSWNYATSRHAE
ncbi:F-box domain [Arabidopsis thaliana x Arabidopsis arenosa]|uniref:F-box domain n=1 Tax=Arabidopsis thaliana x Arabidopsis arenosa TaxID=1240361 RepID=A0A8T2C3D5_9BRAS|nr:F-box domain [Arabidopsis thaliana x Arabidopsis arenosa]